MPLKFQINHRSALAIFLVSVLLTSANIGIAAQPAEADQSDLVAKAITIGFHSSVYSETLAENRPLQIYLPANYQSTPNTRYPVLYLLDGDRNFHHATGLVDYLANSMMGPPMIVVAIPNTDRNRDFAPAALAAPADSTGQGRFYTFLKTELIPHIDQTYPTNSYRILWGHSATATFVLNALAWDPELFQAYLAASPSLGRDPAAVADAVLAALATFDPTPRSFFTCFGTIEDERFSRAAPVLKDTFNAAAPDWLTWRVDWYEGDSHMTTPHQNLYDGLKRIFAPWRIDRQKLMEGGIDYLRSQQQGMRERYGAEWSIPESVIGPAARSLLFQGEHQ